MATPQECIEIYIQAKDQNRPYLMPRVFATDAQVEMLVRTNAIAFGESSTARIEQLTITVELRSCSPRCNCNPS